MDYSNVKSSDAVSQHPEPGMTRQVLSHNEQLMLVRHHFEAGWAGARHSHPHGQLVYVVKGAIRLVVGPTVIVLRDGDSVVVDGDVEHEASALEPSEVLDVFTPVRADYRPGA